MVDLLCPIDALNKRGYGNLGIRNIGESIMVNLDYMRLVSQSYNGPDVTDSLSVLKQSVTVFRTHSAIKSIISVTKRSSITFIKLQI